MPKLLSAANVPRMPACIIAGSDRRDWDKGGRPREIDERERKTVDW
jgi:hypothetical protein